LSILTEGSATLGELRSGDRVTALTGPGSLICVNCGYAISMEALDALPTCPTCGGSRFRRGSLFDQPTVDVGAIEPTEEAPEWLEEVRRELTQSGSYLAFEDDGEPRTVPIEEGWMRIGRSSGADLRLDDPTVSRRHALIVLTPEGELRALDDRSLNGLFVNAERVEWSPLSDGDELEIGRYRLFVVEV
jgi:predicted  nucleic acid-binding Zn-ribbon protein